MNLVLGDVLETIYVVDDDENDEEIRVSRALHLLPCRVQTDRRSDTNLAQTVTKKSEMLFVRGMCSQPEIGGVVRLFTDRTLQAIASCSFHRTTLHEHGI